MDVQELIRNEEGEIVEEALHAIAWLASYEKDGEARTRARLTALCRMVGDAVGTRDLAPLVAHAERIARERHAAGYDRHEVSRAVAALEEAIWFRVMARFAPAEQAWALGLVGTAFSHAREALTRVFAEVGAGDVPPHVDLSTLFRGGGRRDRFTDEMVQPV